MAHDELTVMLDLDAEVLHEYHRDLVDWVAREAVERPRILDLGAGSGTGTLALARALPGSVITAVDLSPEMLALLRQRADRAGLRDRVQVLEADLDASWPELGPVDVIWAAASMHQPTPASRRWWSGVSTSTCGRHYRRPPGVMQRSPCAGCATVWRGGCRRQILPRSTGLSPGSPIAATSASEQSERYGSPAVERGDNRW